MSETKWEVLDVDNRLVHVAGDEEVICRTNLCSRARQIAREHNTHAALVDVLFNVRSHVALDSSGRFLRLLPEIDAALAAAKGATSEHR